jgi:hypothetical protein
MAKVKVVAKKPQKFTIKLKMPNFKFKFPKPNLGDYKRFVKPALLVLGVLIAFILIDLFVQYLNNDYSIAVVNGTRVSKNEYHKKLETLYGQSVAKQMIDEEIIKQEAKKADIVATEEEIQDRLDSIVSDVGGQEAYESVLKANGIEEKDLVDQLELNIITSKIIEPTLQYTEDDVKAFFDQYSGVIFPNETAALEEGEKLDYEQYKDGTKEYFLQQEVEKEKYTWIDSLYSTYKIQDNSAEKPTYGFLKTTINIFKNLFDKANSNTEAAE